MACFRGEATMHVKGIKRNNINEHMCECVCEMNIMLHFFVRELKIKSNMRGPNTIPIFFH